MVDLGTKMVIESSRSLTRLSSARIIFLRWMLEGFL